MAGFSERLKLLRKEKKLTQKEIADKLGVNRVTVKDVFKLCLKIVLFILFIFFLYAFLISNVDMFFTVICALWVFCIIYRFCSN